MSVQKWFVKQNNGNFTVGIVGHDFSCDVPSSEQAFQKLRAHRVPDDLIASARAQLEMSDQAYIDVPVGGEFRQIG